MKISPEKTVVGFIGTGVMGASMAGNLIAGGYRLNIFSRTREKAQSLIDRGAVWKSSVAELASASDAIISMVGFPSDVEAIYMGDGGILANAPQGCLVIDMTTSSPSLARTIAAEAGARGITVLDAPVSGGDVGARNGTLSIMVGGEKEACDAAFPLFEVMGKNIVYQGPAGAGQHTKMANQIAIAAGMVAVCESLAYARKAGLDPETVLSSIGAGAAGSWSLNVLGARMIQGDFAPGFYVKHFIKDLDIALDSAQEMGLETPGLNLARRLYQTVAERGWEDNGTQVLFRLFAE